MQELTGVEFERIGSRDHVDQLGPDGEHSAHGFGIAGHPTGVGHDRGQIRLGASHRRAPIHPTDPNGLVFNGGREQLDTRGDHLRISVQQVGHRAFSRVTIEVAKRAACALDVKT
jgi:hypothetical protein